MTILSQKDWRGELKYEIPNGNGGTELKSFGYFNHDDISGDSDSTSIQDPEDGGQLVGGIQTADEFSINRPWKVTRDDAAFKTLWPLRGRSKGQFPVWQLDPITKQPTTAEPLFTFVIQIKGVTKPGSDANSSDPTMLVINLTQQP